MENLNAFLMENADKPIREKEVFVSDRFKDSEGKPILFTIKLLSNDEINDIQKLATVEGKKGKRSIDMVRYKNGIVISALVNPPLNSSKLQDSYGVIGELDLLNKMLVGSEVNRLFAAIVKFNDLDADFDEKVDEAKN